MSLLDTGATSITFADVAMAHHVCKVLQIFFIPLAKFKPVRGFDGWLAPNITHVIYFTLTVQSHSELLAPMLMTKLGQHPLILGKPWMQKHDVIIDMSCNKITFWPGYCQHLTIKIKLQGIALAPSQSKPMRSREEILVWKSGGIVLPFSPKKNLKEVLAGRHIPHTNSGVTEPKERVIPGMKILRKKPNIKTKQKKIASTKKLPELLPHVLPSANGYRCMSKKAEEPLSKYIIPQRQSRALLLTLSLVLLLALLSALLSALLLAALSGTNKLEEKSIQLAMIGAAPFQYLTKQKGIAIFAISMRDIEYQLSKDKKTPTNPATKISECYYDFLDVFSEEASNTVSVHLKHNYVIKLFGKKITAKQRFIACQTHSWLSWRNFSRKTWKRVSSRRAVPFAHHQFS